MWRWFGAREQTTLVGLTSLRTRNPLPMLPKLNRKRALFVLTKIDEILAWERRSEAERDTRFVELGRYLCEVRAGQYWRLETLKSFDEFLARPFPESKRKPYYLMSTACYTQSAKEFLARRRDNPVDFRWPSGVCCPDAFDRGARRLH